MGDDNTIITTTKLWQRSQNSYATTIPKVVRQFQQVDEEAVDDIEVVWKLDMDTLDLTIEFQEDD